MREIPSSYNLKTLSPTALKAMIRLKRRARRVPNNDRMYQMLSTDGSYHHILVIREAGEVECISDKCKAGEYNWACWASRKLWNARRVESEVRHKAS